MWIEGKFINPEHVTAVVPTGVKKRKGAVTSTGCEVWLLSGGVLGFRLPTTQVVAMLGIVKPKE